MFDPCVDICYLKYNKQYTKECDNTYAYAKAVLGNKNKDNVIDYLFDILEEESIAILPIAVEEEKDLFGINI